MKQYILKLLAFLIIALPSKAQQVATQHYDVSNGLSNNVIHGIVQDSKGRIWIATESGLNCFDGYHFTIYKSHNSVLKSNYITALYRDAKHHQIWIGVKGLGIYLINEDNGAITNATPHQIIIGNVMSISPAADGGIWFASHDKIVHYNYQSGKYALFLSNKYKDSYRTIADDFNGKLIIASYYQGLKAIDIKSKKEVQMIEDKNPINKEIIYQLRTDNKQNIWIASNFGLRLLNTRTRKLKYINAIGTCIVHDIVSNGNFKLIATDTSIKKINSSNLSVVETLETDRTSCLYLDNYKNLWIGTQSAGIYLAGKTRSAFTNILDKNTCSIISDGKTIWAGGINALYLLENNQLKRTYSINYHNLSGKVLSLQKEDNQHILLSIFGKLLRFDIATGKTAEIQYNGKNVPAITFYKDRKNTIWIASFNGIYSIRNGKIAYEHKLNKVLANQVTNCIRTDARGYIWIGTMENGIYVFNKAQRLATHLTQSKSFFSNSVMHMRNGSHNRIWLATSEGIGLVTQTPDSFRITHYNNQQGLKDPFIRSIWEDQKGYVWVSTNNGLSFLNMKTHLFSNFDQNDGVPTNNFTGGLTMQPSGMAYITSIDGIIMVNTRDLTKKKRTSPLHFTRCTVLNATVEQMSEQLPELGKDQAYHLDYHQNDIRVTFSVGNKAESKLVDYSYQVDNLVDSWTLTDENTITFRSLAPGKYIIRARARLHGQSWDSASTNSITIIISQPWWWTWYARIIYILSIGCCIYLYFRRYKHHLRIKSDLELERKKYNVEQENNKERLHFFTNITHELRTPLTLIYSPLEELQQSKTLSKEDRYKLGIIHRNSQRLMELINRILEFRKAETNNQQLVVCKSSIADTVKKIIETFKVANQNTAITYITDIEDTSPFIYYDKNVIKSILSNLLNNAAKYTTQGSIGLSLNQLVRNGKQYSCIKIWDTGCGIDADALPRIFERYYQVNGAHQASGTGIGLALVKKLCEQHKIEINVESKVGVGTTFVLLLDNAETYEEALHQENEGCMGKTALREDRTEDSEETDEKKAYPDSNDSHPTVLIVEDHTDINDYIAHALQKSYHILQAKNGETGLELAKERIPEIIICDIMMPGMDGLTMTHLLKKDIRTSHIPIIILTAKTEMQERQKSYDYGATSFITKPFSMTMLKSRIANLLTAQKRTADFILQKITTSAAKENDTANEGKEKAELNFLDQQFINKINEIIFENIASDKLSLNFLAEQLKISLSTLYRKMKALTGVSGNEYIRKIRLDHSLRLMLENGKNISEAAYESGFVDMPYFRNCFKEEYGEVPSEYIKRYKSESPHS